MATALGDREAVTPGGPGAARLEVRGVSKRFGAVQALADVSLRLLPGEAIALAGENGSGKSTLASIIAGAQAADAGEVVLDGVVRDFGRPRDAIDAGVALVSQEPTAVPHLSIGENVLLPRLRAGLGPARRRRLLAEAVPHLERVGLHVDPAAPFATLRQGDRELAEVAKALATNPSVLILDEASTRLPDPERLFAVVDELVAGGMSAILITHRLQEIRRLASRAVVLRDGRLVGELDADHLGDEEISAAMVGRELGDFFHKREVPAGRTVLRVRGLVTDRYPTPIDLDVAAGEIVGLAGLVGAGRSEVLEAIAGVRASRAGVVAVGNAPLAPPARAPLAARRAGIALVPEDRFTQGLVRGASITANLSLGSHRVLARTRRAAERATAAEAVATFRIRCASAEAPVATLSGGNAQKVVLARALANRPKVLLLDEPTRGVDVGAKAEIYRIVGDLVAGGTGVLVASSDLLELLGICDRILVLCEGRVAGELPRSVATEETIALLCAGGSTR